MHIIYLIKILYYSWFSRETELIRDSYSYIDIDIDIRKRERERREIIRIGLHSYGGGKFPQSAVCKLENQGRSL